MYFSPPLVKDEYGLFTGNVIDYRTDYGESVEVYITVSETQKKNEYLSGVSHTVYGSIIIRTSSELIASQQKALVEAVLSTLTEL